LAAGGACFYRIESNCAAPAFKVNNATSSGPYDVEYIEFSADDLGNATVVSVAGADLSTSATIRNGSPAANMPARFHNFGDGAGSAKIYMQKMSGSNATATGTAGRWSVTAGGKKVWGVAD